MIGPARPVPSPLDRRTADLARLADETWDLVVVGGGIVGVGAALDAASRGLRVALVEQDDIAVGTSSRSSRLIHGGLRYLEQLQVGIVVESLAERRRLLRLAPHLVRLETFLFPLYGPPVVPRAFYGAGMLMYDVLGSARSGGIHRHLGVRETLEWAPGLRRERLRGALAYHDAMEDDARYALAVARTAVDLGAVVLTRVRASGRLRVGRRADDPLAGIRAVDVLGGDELEVRSAAVLDATGVWASRPDHPFGGGTSSVLPTRGSHLVIPRERVPLRGAVTLRAGGRNAFFVPWPRHWVVGTTDVEDRSGAERPAASGAEVDEILGTVNRVMDVGLTRDDVVGTFAGLRPLVAPTGAAATTRISREHRIVVEPDGLVRISGGKYTTYRVMARQAVDASLGEAARRRSSATADLPIHGAPPVEPGVAPRSAVRALERGLVRSHGVTPEVAEHLVARHGTEAADVLAAGPPAPLVEGYPHLDVEVVWAVDRELALSLDDVLARRLRLAMELRDRGASIAGRVAALMGERLGWDEGRREREVEGYLAGAHREYDVPREA